MLQIVEELFQRHQSITAHLKKLEEAIDGTSSGKSPGETPKCKEKYTSRSRYLRGKLCEDMLDLLLPFAEQAHWVALEFYIIQRDMTNSICLSEERQVFNAEPCYFIQEEVEGPETEPCEMLAGSTNTLHRCGQ